MTDWRFFRYRPGKAHLWEPHGGSIWHSRCQRMAVVDLFNATYPLAVENGLILKCKQCLPFERRQEAA